MSTGATMTAMRNFELNALGDGRFELVGEMSFDTADEILQQSETLFGDYQSLHVDLSKVDNADSAGLALLLEWKALANQRSGAISYVGVPESVQAIAATTEVVDFIR